MSDDIIPTRPPNPGEILLRQKFYESVAAQDELMGKVSGQLLTLELAIPGIYATALKLVHGDKATLQLNPAFYLTYGFWLLALALTLYALIPRDWKVDPAILRQDPARLHEGLGLEDFFRQTAQHKRRLLIASSILFFLGIISAGFTL
jgi:hypothetical protein